MDDVPRWLIIPLGVLVIACWIGGAWVVFGATRYRGRLPKTLWRGAVVAFPVTAFLLFALCDRFGRSRPAEERPTWKWVAIHLLVIALGIPAYLIAKQRAIANVQTQVKRAYADEWWFKKSETGRPALCVAMSGGGIRSAAFNIGVLRVLHERGLLAKTDVMSAVSGGSYVLSWYLLQQFYSQQPNGPRQSLEKTQKAMFDWNDVYQQHLANHARQFRATDSVSYYASAAWSLVYDISAFNMVRLISVLGNENLRNSSSSREGYGTWSRATPTISKSSLASWPPGDYRARPTECPS